MKKSLILFFSSVYLLLFAIKCEGPEDAAPDPADFGYLNLSVGLEVEAIPTGRVEAVSTDDFLVTIHDANDGSEVLRFNTYLEVPDEVQLPTGLYFVRATNLEFPEDAAFEQPWYFGESDVFTIDKEELKTISVLCTLANCKISFNYSQNVLDNFTNWNATATIDNGNGTGAFLEWIQDDPAEGYFLTDLPIDIEVFLEYIKITDPDQSITRTFTTTIDDPQPATHYLINVDAALEDGKIVINITVDDDFETIEIDLGDEIIPETVTDIDGNEYPVVQIGNQLWMAENLRVTQLNDGTPIPNVPDADTWATTSSEALSWLHNNESQYKSTYGGLYNWYALENGNLCPSGWHLPSNNEWVALENFIGEGEYSTADALKSTSGWTNNGNQYNGLDIYGFNALPAGARFSTGSFLATGFTTFWWTIDLDQQANRILRVFSGGGGQLAYSGDNSNGGFSVRCVKD